MLNWSYRRDSISDIVASWQQTNKILQLSILFHFSNEIKIYFKKATKKVHFFAKLFSWDRHENLKNALHCCFHYTFSIVPLCRQATPLSASLVAGLLQPEHASQSQLTKWCLFQQSSCCLYKTSVQCPQHAAQNLDSHCLSTSFRPEKDHHSLWLQKLTKGFHWCYNHLRVYYLYSGSGTLLAGQECMVLFRACSCPDLALWHSVHEHSKIHIHVLASLNYQHKDRKDGLPVCGLQELCPPFELKLQSLYDVTAAKHHLSQRSK